MLEFRALALRRASALLFEDVEFNIYPGQKVGITGANGCGKSSLLALIRGELSPDQGEVRMPPHWLLASVAQEAELSSRLAIDYVIDGDAELDRHGHGLPVQRNAAASRQRERLSE